MPLLLDRHPKLGGGLGDLAGDGSCALLRLGAEHLRLLRLEPLPGVLAAVEVLDERAEVGELAPGLLGPCRVDVRQPLLDAREDHLEAGETACGGDDESAAEDTTAAAPATETGSAADLGGVEDYLLEHTGLLTCFTSQLQADAQAYHDLAEEAGFDYAVLWDERADELVPLLEKMKADWVDGNPYYERMEGVVAGTPSLAEYDVIRAAAASTAAASDAIDLGWFNSTPLLTAT